VIDGTLKNIKYVKSDPIYWTSNLESKCQFIDNSNINQLLIANCISGDIGLLSIDIDGKDYCVWKSIEAVTPRIVVPRYFRWAARASKMGKRLGGFLPRPRLIPEIDGNCSGGREKGQCCVMECFKVEKPNKT
jgi:hypothetical protein